MVKMRYILAALCTMLCISCSEGGRKSYCNPVDLDYGWGIFTDGLPLCRTSADPAIVCFKGRYYLFSTHDIGGYRVSDDLLNWSDRHFNEEVSEAALNGKTYVAPAVAADDNYVYFIKLNRNKEEDRVKIIRSSDPDKGDWEVCGEIKKVSDPSMFIDDGRFFITYGLGSGIRMFELDPQAFEEIPGSERLIKEKVTDVAQCEGGYDFGRREIFDEIEAPEWKGRYNRTPCEEGSWMVKAGDRYYLQFATPGTICIWYCDAVMTAGSIDGEFTLEPYNPVSLKAGGFIGSAGHSGVFQDKFGNWWEISTMWVGNSNEFERRLGLFPVTFDAQGRMQVHTTLGDYPMTVPQRKFDARTESNLMGWWCLSYGAECTASSFAEGFGPENASDENIRTWWAAQSGDDNEWLQMDLGAVKAINALQLNFAELNHTPETFDEDYTAYKVFASEDGVKWKEIIDKSRNRRTNPHEYVELKKAVRARYIKVGCVHAMNGVAFGIRDLRVFGSGEGQKPAQVSKLNVTRDAKDERFAQLEWSPVGNAQGYLVRFGPDKDFLNQVIQVKGSDVSSLLIHILTKGVSYCYRIDTYNDNGITEGVVITENDNKNINS